MEMQPAPNEPESLPNPDAPDPQSHDVPDYRPVLNELLSLGAELSRIIVQRAAAEPPTPVAEAAIAFDRVSRSVRRTVLLLRHLDEPAKPSAAQHRVTARKRILREVEDAIDLATDEWVRPIPEPEKAELRLELLDRLDSPETEDDITGRPIEDIIRDICRDLRVRNQDTGQRGRRRTPADIEALNACVAKPRGEPAKTFAATKGDRPPAPQTSHSDPPPADDPDDDMAELFELHEFILSHASGPNPKSPAGDSGRSPRAGPW